MSLSLFISLFAFSQSLLIASISFMRRQHRHVYLPLAIFFLANAMTYPWLLFNELENLQGWRTGLEVFALAAIFVLPPSLLFYVRALTNALSPKFNLKQLWHLLPFFIGLITCSLVIALPVEARIRLIDGPEVSNMFELVTGLLLVLMFLSFPLLSAVYFTVIILTLIKYRQRLKNLYASTVGKELHWVGGVVALFAFDWLMNFASGLLEFWGYVRFYDDTTESLVDLALFWLLAIWALRPIIIEDSLETLDLSLDKQNANKYGRAALTQERKTSIAKKIEASMAHQNLYLDPNFSLHRLAKAINEQGNNVSQTLNSEIGETFFDYINGWRIREALPEILNANKNILTIANDFGFNSQSSFYKAFKAETGLTPTAYRKTYQLKAMHLLPHKP